MDYSEDDGEFHFVAVAEEEGVVCCVPCWVHAKGVYADLSSRDQLSDFEFLRPCPSRFKQRNRFRKQVIVYQPGIPSVRLPIRSMRYMEKHPINNTIYRPE